MVVMNVGHDAVYYVNPTSEGDTVIFSMQQTGCFVLAAKDAIEAGNCHQSGCLLTVKARSAQMGLQTWFNDCQYVDLDVAIASSPCSPA